MSTSRVITYLRTLRSLRPVFYPEIASGLLNINNQFTEKQIEDGDIPVPLIKGFINIRQKFPEVKG